MVRLGNAGGRRHLRSIFHDLAWRYGVRMPAVIRPADETDADAITSVFLASRAAAMPYLPRLYDDEQTGAFITHVVLPQCRV